MNVKFVFYFTMIFDLLAIVGSVIYYIYTGTDNFTQGGNISKLSFLQLLIISRLSYKILKIRKPRNVSLSLKSSSAIWGFISIGFLYLAADEYFSIHENIDYFIHYLFNMQETNLTDRIDDIIIGIYGIIGIWLLYLYREEMKRFKDAFPLLIAGFIMLFLTVGFDILTNGKDILSMFLEANVVALIYHPLELVEESFKVMAEACYLVAFYMVLDKSRRMLAKSEESGLATS